MELATVKIEYTDGSELVVDRDAIKYISSVPSDVLDVNNLSIQSAYEGLQDEDLKSPWVFELSRVDFRNKLKEEKEDRMNRIGFLQETKRIVQSNGLWNGETEHMGIGISNSEKYDCILPELHQYGSTRRNKKVLEDEVTKFKRRNLLEN